MNVTSLITMNYKKTNLVLSEVEWANSNPNKPNFQKAQMNVNSFITKDYIKNDDFLVRINKPNSNPISSKAKMSANSLLTMDYDNVTAFQLQKNKPKQTQSLVKDLITLVKNSCAPCRMLLQCILENLNKPGELKTERKFRSRLRIPHLLSIGSRLIGAGDPMNLLGIMPAKEGKIVLKHSFLSAVADYGSASCFLSFTKQSRDRNRAATVRER